METIRSGSGCSAGRELCLKGVKCMNRGEYTAAVLKGLRHVTASEKEQIRKELDGHMEDHALELMERGWEREEAEEKAAACMGDPMEVSKELQKCYSYGWLIVGRVLGVVLVLLVLLSVTELGSAGYGLVMQWQAQHNPTKHMGEEQRAQIRRELDITVDCGNSVLQFYAVGESEEGETTVHYLIYNKTPFRFVAKNIGIRYEHPEADEHEMDRGGGYFSDAWVHYGNDDLVPPKGAESVTAVVTWGSRETRVEIPVTWEVAA